MMQSKLSSFFAVLTLCLFVGFEVALALPKGNKNALGPASSVSQNMRNVFISEDNNPPLDASTFLQRSAYFGGARSDVAADNLIQQAMGWGMAFTAVQYGLNTVKGADFVPGPPNDFTHTWKDGAYAFAFTCHKYGQGIVDDLNAKCKNCGKTYTSAIVWGTFKGMNFDKDAVMNAGCSALEITNSPDCFANFPKGCSIRAVGESVDLWNGEPKRVVVNAKSRKELIDGINNYAKATHQAITVPSS